jgi:hypothetical protein
MLKNPKIEDNAVLVYDIRFAVKAFPTWEKFLPPKTS